MSDPWTPRSVLTGEWVTEPETAFGFDDGFELGGFDTEPWANVPATTANWTEGN